MLKLTINRVCEHCGANFTAKTTTTRFCSDSCAKRAYKRRKRQECIEMCSGGAAQQLQDELEKRYPEIMTPELKDRLEISERSIFRYIEVFKDAGYALHKKDKNIHKLYKMPADFIDLKDLMYISSDVDAASDG